MSLKAFHVVIILSSILFCLGFGAWEVRAYQVTGGGLDLFLGVFSLTAGAALIVYFKAMLRKLRHISFL